MSFDTDTNRQERLALARDVAEHLEYAARVSDDYYKLAKRIGFYKSYFIVAVFVAAIAVILLWVGTLWMWFGLLVLAAVNFLGNSFLGQKNADCWSWGGLWAGLAYQLRRRVENETHEEDQEDLEEVRNKLYAVSEQMEALRWEARKDYISPDSRRIEVPALYPYPTIGGGQKGERKGGRIRQESMDELRYALVLVPVLLLGMAVVAVIGGLRELTDPATVFVADKLDNLSQAVRPAAADEDTLQGTLEPPEARTWDEIIATWMEASDEWGGDFDGWMQSQGLPRDLQEQMQGAVGLFKSSAFLPELHQMAMLHGWGDDLGVCDEITRFLEQEEPARYGCAFLADVDVKDGTIPMRTP